MSGPASLPVKLVPSNIRPIAYRILSKKHGLNIQTDALSVLTDVIGLRFGAEWRGPKAQLFIEEIAKSWKLQDRGLFVDGPGLEQVVKELSKEKSVERDEPQKASRSDTLMDIDSEAAKSKDEVVINWTDYFNFVTPDTQPNFEFDRVRKQFVPRPVAGSKLKSSLKAATDYFNSRYFLLVDRLSRHENFQKQSFSSLAAINTTLNKDDVKYDITLIKNVLGRDGGRFILFGLLSKNINGNYILEDSTDHIELDFTHTLPTEGSFYMPGMFLIVEGIYSASGGSMSNDASVISGRFHVSNVSHPPPERRDVALKTYGYLDFMGILGGNSKSIGTTGKIDKPLRKKLSAVEKALGGHKIIYLGANCFLDDKKIMAGLKKFFTKIEDSLVEQQNSDEQETPLAIVMTGSFSSQPLTAVNGSSTQVSNSENYKSSFDDFAALLANYPVVIKTCKLVLIPGPNDPWQSSYSLGRGSLTNLPQKPIPKVFVTRLERLLPKGNLIFGGNPMRVNYLSQEIVIYRDDLMNKLKRNDIVFQEKLDQLMAEAEKENIEEGLDAKRIVGDQSGYLSTKIKQARQLVKTILDQGNLQPFLKDLKVIDPNYSHVLRIEPLPTTLVLFDSRFESFEVTYNGCKVVNIGDIINNKNSKTLNYAEYYPTNKSYAFREQYF
ncbi:hypothetical protein FT663_00818 [Candidozyma haemuli var. vulneris]|uniref:DNA polymerase epsilon subunit B n=1 Tax=Candidozyma haemuli TaxID=45357 RepID=A0A2V1AQ33_9ASCO|nr:hypothetical protein CXQ85_001672 [[Candida] haemuloni]KAF3992908.1 hypothetical protein FT662_00910 [[Candida] haemuloni var. vulneris]KAF3995119.1 hypothetical protein FT663_00818 [[Candida] haemuloni var. vulneris]PVH19895.1 hypothetical protein CXQ85_001672 [[Candida] haemuloni]